MTRNIQMTQQFSTWGDKLLQHCARLDAIQRERRFYPITLQLAPTEACDSDCPFCSVANRPKGKIPWPDLSEGVSQFRSLGVKSVEITGGGNPLLYRDSDKTIDDVVTLCRWTNSLQVGIITNSEAPRKHLSLWSLQNLSWLRVSLAKLDEGKTADDYNFDDVPEGRLGLSYIVHAQTHPDVFLEMTKLVARYPHIKFVRIAPDCLTDDSLDFAPRWGDLIHRLGDQFFIKDIGDNYHPYPHGCWVGMLRPYWTSTGVYICTSHVLKQRTYLPEYRLCGPDDITSTWDRMNARFASGQSPYDINISQCGHCYYHNNNRLLHAVSSPLPDPDFA